MPHATPAFVGWWFAASLSAAAYFHPEVLCQPRTTLSLLVRALHVVCSMGMASLAVAALAPSRLDVGLACAGETPGSRRALLAFAVARRRPFFFFSSPVARPFHPPPPPR